MGDAALDLLVLQYLEKRKCVQALRAFQEEARAGTDMTLAPHFSKDKGIVEDLLLYLVADNDPEQYVKAFDRLASWVDHSLDLYQAELSRLLYPVFIHCYLHLIGKEATEEAARLMTRHKRRFSDAVGANPRTRRQELNELQTIAAPENLKTHRLAQTMLSTRFPARLCTYSFELVTTFLTSSKPLALLLSIVNERLKIQVVDGPPLGADQEEPEALELLSGHVPQDSLTKNQQPLQLSALQRCATITAASAQGSVERKHAAQRLAAALPDAGDEQAGAEGAGPKRKGKRLKEDKSRKEADKAARADEEGMAAQVPLLGMSEKLEGSMMDDISHRTVVGPEALPSAVFFTFLNTHQSLNCMAFAMDGTLVAGGFADSSIRLHRVAAEDRQAPSEAGLQAGTTFLRGHTGAVFGVDFSLDRQLLFSASADGSVRLWSTELGANLAAYRGHNLAVWDVAAGPLGYFASASADRTARVWATEHALPLRILAGHYTDVDVVRWHPNGHYVGTGSSDRTVRLWDMRDGQSVRILAGHKAPITGLAFSPDGKLAASGDEDGSISVWDLGQAKRLDTGSGHSAAVWALAFSHVDGAVLASGAADNTVRLWTQAAATSGSDPQHDSQGGCLVPPSSVATVKA